LHCFLWHLLFDGDEGSAILNKGFAARRQQESEQGLQVLDLFRVERKVLDAAASYQGERLVNKDQRAGATSIAQGHFLVISCTHGRQHCFAEDLQLDGIHCHVLHAAVWVLYLHAEGETEWEEGEQDAAEGVPGMGFETRRVILKSFQITFFSYLQKYFAVFFNETWIHFTIHLAVTIMIHNKV